MHAWLSHFFRLLNYQLKMWIACLSHTKVATFASFSFFFLCSSRTCRSIWIFSCHAAIDFRLICWCLVAMRNSLAWRSYRCNRFHFWIARSSSSCRCLASSMIGCSMSFCRSASMSCRDDSPFYLHLSASINPTDKLEGKPEPRRDAYVDDDEPCNWCDQKSIKFYLFTRILSPSLLSLAVIIVIRIFSVWSGVSRHYFRFAPRALSSTLIATLRRLVTLLSKLHLRLSGYFV